jgi:hypothetical protein
MHVPALREQKCGMVVQHNVLAVMGKACLSQLRYLVSHPCKLLCV